MGLRVAIIGCGLIGQKRAKALGNAKLVAVVDPIAERAESLARAHHCAVERDIEACVAREDIDAVILSATNDQLAALTLAAVVHGKHVLVEKPAGRSAAELRPVAAAARRRGVTVKVGFNHRFHPALWKAKELCDLGVLGPLLFVRGRYGHGGRVGYDREWRADPERAGGGEMLDQGVHLIDLARWYLGDFTSVDGHVATYFWNMPVEDNGFAMLRTATGQVAWLHASCTEWKNTFSLEIYGRDGKLQIDGLGGSYGTERLSWYRMLPEMGPPETSIWEYPQADRSWEAEFAHFADCIATGARPAGNLDDAVAVLEVIDELYRRQGLYGRIDARAA